LVPGVSVRGTGCTGACFCCKPILLQAYCNRPCCQWWQSVIVSTHSATVLLQYDHRQHQQQISASASAPTSLLCCVACRETEFSCCARMCVACRPHAALQLCHNWLPVRELSDTCSSMQAMHVRLRKEPGSTTCGRVSGRVNALCRQQAPYRQQLAAAVAVTAAFGPLPMHAVADCNSARPVQQLFIWQRHHCCCCSGLGCCLQQ
jgi:hypothetical protein